MQLLPRLVKKGRQGTVMGMQPRLEGLKVNDLAHLVQRSRLTSNYMQFGG